ncbi:MAG: lipoprotein signal peptidase [Betaproteobacteria bacterium]|nr:lipoprotein signal peptidase [Betaproteobacteria bacterium]
MPEGARGSVAIPAAVGSSRRLLRWLGLAVLVVLLDQASKLWIAALLPYGRSIRVGPILDLVLVYNPGAAFSFLSDAGGWQRWFFIVLAAGVSVWIVALIRRHAREFLLPLALSLILGGAVGNLIDRVVVGAVVDFLYFHLGSHYWPAFNVADSAITVGVALMLWQQLRPARCGAGAAPQP